MSTMWDPAIEHLYQKFKSRLQAELLVEIPFSPLDGDYGRLVEGCSQRQIEAGDGSAEEIGGP